MKTHPKFGRIGLWTLLMLLPVVAGGSANFASSRQIAASATPAEDCAHFLPYSSDPQHIWNRVHRRLLERRDRNGNLWGCDDVDPLLWVHTTHLLHGYPYKETVSLLDEFTRTHAERLIRDPVQRAVFQHDLWAVFDWLSGPFMSDHEEQRAELERRLATLIKAVALTPDEIEHLPDNYASIRGSSTSDGFSLPDPDMGWMLIGRDDATPVAPVHSFPFPRSLFLVYMKLPPGGPEPAAYLEAMRVYSRLQLENDCMLKPCSPPQFPVSTELALVRRSILVDNTGRPVISPITETVQLRRYLEIPAQYTIDWRGVMQRRAEFQITRRALSQSKIALRRIGDEESQFTIFATHGFDLEGPSVTLKRCSNCHQGIGVISFTSYSRVQFENKNTFIMVHAGNEAAESAAALAYLEKRDSWKQLQRLIH